MAWTPEKIQNADFGHLYDAAEWMGRQHPRWDMHFSAQEAALAGLDWKGLAGTAAQLDEQRNKLTAQTMAGLAQEAQEAVFLAAGTVDSAKSQASSAIEAARAADFEVDEGFGVKDKLPYNKFTAAARQAQAQLHAGQIAVQVTAFQGALAGAATTLQTHAGVLHGARMADGGGVPTTMMGHGYKQDPIISNPAEPDKPNPIIGPPPPHNPPKTDDKSLADQALDGMIDVVGGTLTTTVGVAGVIGGGVAEPETGGLSTVAIGGGLTAIAGGTKMVEDGLDKLLHLGNGDGK